MKKKKIAGTNQAKNSKNVVRRFTVIEPEKTPAARVSGSEIKKLKKPFLQNESNLDEQSHS